MELPVVQWSEEIKLKTAGLPRFPLILPTEQLSADALLRQISQQCEFGSDYQQFADQVTQACGLRHTAYSCASSANFLNYYILIWPTLQSVQDLKFSQAASFNFDGFTFQFPLQFEALYCQLNIAGMKVLENDFVAALQTVKGLLNVEFEEPNFRKICGFFETYCEVLIARQSHVQTAFVRADGLNQTLQLNSTVINQLSATLGPVAPPSLPGEKLQQSDKLNDYQNMSQNLTQLNQSPVEAPHMPVLPLAPWGNQTAANLPALPPSLQTQLIVLTSQKENLIERQEKDQNSVIQELERQENAEGVKEAEQADEHEKIDKNKLQALVPNAEENLLQQDGVNEQTPYPKQSQAIVQSSGQIHQVDQLPFRILDDYQAEINMIDKLLKIQISSKSCQAIQAFFREEKSQLLELIKAKVVEILQFQCPIYLNAAFGSQLDTQQLVVQPIQLQVAGKIQQIYPKGYRETYAKALEVFKAATTKYDDILNQQITAFTKKEKQVEATLTAIVQNPINVSENMQKFLQLENTGQQLTTFLQNMPVIPQFSTNIVQIHQFLNQILNLDGQNLMKYPKGRWNSTKAVKTIQDKISEVGNEQRKIAELTVNVGPLQNFNTNQFRQLFEYKTKQQSDQLSQTINTKIENPINQLIQRNREIGNQIRQLCEQVKAGIPDLDFPQFVAYCKINNIPIGINNLQQNAISVQNYAIKFTADGKQLTELDKQMNELYNQGLQLKQNLLIELGVSPELMNSQASQFVNLFQIIQENGEKIVQIQQTIQHLQQEAQQFSENYSKQVTTQWAQFSQDPNFVLTIDF